MKQFKSKKGGLITLLISIGIIIGLLIAYMILNIWATYKLEVDTSSGEIINSINKLNIGIEPGKTMLNTTVKLTNPTLIPVLSTGFNFDISYGEIELGKGKTGFIFMMPNSNKDFPISIELDNANTRKAIFSGIIDILGNDVKKITMRFYAGIGKFQIAVREI